MLPGMELLGCPDLQVPHEVMQHVVKVESSYNPFAIGVVGGRLARQPGSLREAISTVRMLEDRGFNFSVGVAQINRYNLQKYGLTSYARAFEVCPNLSAGARILSECYQRHRDWGKAFSCYYSGNPVTGFRHGYVQKIFASIAQSQAPKARKLALIGKAPRPEVLATQAPQRRLPVKSQAGPASAARHALEANLPSRLESVPASGAAEGVHGEPQRAPSQAVRVELADEGPPVLLESVPVDAFAPTSQVAGDGAFVF